MSTDLKVGDEVVTESTLWYDNDGQAWMMSDNYLGMRETVKQIEGDRVWLKYPGMFFHPDSLLRVADLDRLAKERAPQPEPVRFKKSDTVRIKADVTGVVTDTDYDWDDGEAFGEVFVNGQWYKPGDDITIEKVKAPLPTTKGSLIRRSNPLGGFVYRMLTRQGWTDPHGGLSVTMKDILASGNYDYDVIHDAGKADDGMPF